VEKYGSGIKRILEAFREYSLPEPRFEEIGNGFMLTVCKNISGYLRQEKTTRKIFALIGQHTDITRKDIANVLSDSERCQVPPCKFEEERDSAAHRAGQGRGVGSDFGALIYTMMRPTHPVNTCPLEN